MKILKILNSHDSGGVFRSENQYIRIIKGLGHFVDLVIVGNGDKLQQYKDSVEKSILLPALDVAYSGSIFKIFKSLRASMDHSVHNATVALPDNKYDAIIYRRPYYLQIAGAFSKRLKTQAYWHMPSAVNRKLGRIYYTYYLRKYGIVPIANSQYTARSLGPICKDVVYPGFDEDKIKDTNGDYRSELNINTESIVFGLAARINYDKAQDLVISAFIELLKKHPDIHLVIAGGPLESEFGVHCQTLAKDHKNNVHFLGYIHTGGKYFNTLNYFINSRRDEEPFGIGIVEALGAGKPVIAYYLGGPSESIIHGFNGWLVKSSDAISYYSAMNKAVEDIALYGTLSKNATTSSKQFSANVNVQKLLSIIENTNISHR